MVAVSLTNTNFTLCCSRGSGKPHSYRDGTFRQLARNSANSHSSLFLSDTRCATYKPDIRYPRDSCRKTSSKSCISHSNCHSHTLFEIIMYRGQKYFPQNRIYIRHCVHTSFKSEVRIFASLAMMLLCFISM